MQMFTTWRTRKALWLAQCIRLMRSLIRSLTPAQKITDELPIDVALGKLDYMEIVGFSDHRSTAAVWYRLLNLGYHIPAGAGTDAMANFASLRGPVGMNRVFVRVPGGILEMKAWLDGLKKGRTFATNGPLLKFILGGQQIGDTVRFAIGRRDAIPFTAKIALDCSSRSSGSGVQRKSGGDVETGCGAHVQRREWNDSRERKRMVRAAGFERSS